MEMSFKAQEDFRISASTASNTTQMQVLPQTRPPACISSEEEEAEGNHPSLFLEVF